MPPFSLLTICGLPELHAYSTRRVTHVLSLLDPDWPDPDAFLNYGLHTRTTVNFHDVIGPVPGTTSPTLQHLETILEFGRSLSDAEVGPDELHVLVHCHVGISRSTAAVASLLAQAQPDLDGDLVFGRVREIRPRAWPNSIMIGFADALLNRNGKLFDALARHYAKQLCNYPELIDAQRNNGRGLEVDMGLATGLITVD